MLALLLLVGSTQFLQPGNHADGADGRVRVVAEDPALPFDMEVKRGRQTVAVAKLAERNFEEMSQLVRAELQKYSSAVLEGVLSRICLFETMAVDGVCFAGTYDRRKKTVYMARSCAKGPMAGRELARTLHHEISSLLFHAHPSAFTLESWQALNPPDFEYIGHVRARELGQTSSTFTDTLNEAGFLNEYARISIEEDLNTIATELLAGSAEFWGRKDRYPRLAAKVDLVVAFYARLDPELTEDRFRSWADVP